MSRSLFLPLAVLVLAMSCRPSDTMQTADAAFLLGATTGLAAGDATKASGLRYLYLTMTELGIATAAKPDLAGWGERVSLQVRTPSPTLNIDFSMLAPSRADGPLGELHGLKTFRMVKGKNGVFSDLVGTVFYGDDGSEVTSLILCDPSFPSPPCRHTFRAAEASVTATYSMNYLPHWREIEQATRRLLSSGRR